MNNKRPKLRHSGLLPPPGKRLYSKRTCTYVESNKYNSYKTDANTENIRCVGVKRPGSSTDTRPELLSQLQSWCQRGGVVFTLLQQVGFTDVFDSNISKLSAEANDMCCHCRCGGSPLKGSQHGGDTCQCPFISTIFHYWPLAFVFRLLRWPQK